MMIKRNNTAGFYATTATVWFIVLITIGAEKIAPLKSWLANITGHHWTTKGIFSLIFFAVMLMLFSKVREKENIAKGARAVLWNVLIGALVIFLFFFLHYLEAL